jgi:uncharacterized protein YeaO (DUF488 family)
MPVKTRRWNDPAEPDDGYRLLICRYRPRGVKREGEPWDAWCPELGPSKELHAAVYGKTGEPIGWDEYARRFREEMEGRNFFLDGFAERVRRGETITLLCASSCVDPAKCHRSIVKEMLEARAKGRSRG